ncbi:MAG: RNA polymerase sigma factor [Gemmataceae bacterium]|nr:RNA polymerase sigma factor [Gemmataceae bacterium]
MGPELLGRLVDQHAAALVLYARQWCATPEDVVQEAFLKLVAQKKPPNSPLAWLYRVVRNGALSAARAERRRRHHEAVAATRMPGWFTASAGARLDVEAATAALQTLPLEQREIIVAHLWGGLSFEQIAELAGCSSSTAHRWYVAGLSALRERLRIPCPNKPTMPS